MARTGNKLGLLSLVMAIGLLGTAIPTGCSMEKSGYRNISVEPFFNMMGRKDFVLINVHVPYQGEIPRTDMLIPFDAIDQHKDELPKDRDTPIVVYCLTGPMGDVAAQKLVRMGYTRVIHFQGGMRAWKGAGRPLAFRQK